MHVSIKIYLKLYFWQFMSIALNFISLYIAIPKLSDNPTIYGIYSICVGLNMFLSYADIGFVGAAQKYASESYVKNDIIEEVKITAFAIFILWGVSLVFIGTILFLSFQPQMLIKNLDYRYIDTAKYLLWILCLSSQIIVFQRFLQITFGIRLKDFLYQKYNVLANGVKILSVFYFFSNDNYDITGYFLFLQLVNFVGLIYAMFIAYKQFNYPFYYFFSQFRFSKNVFNKTKKIAFSSFILTISWILYYELDSVAISKIWGAEMVAIYAIGFSLLSVFRVIFGSIFNPFAARFNHFIGIADSEGLKAIVKRVVYLSFPVFIILITTIVCFAEPLIISWVGSRYEKSILIAQLLICYNLLGFVSYPTGILLIALEKNKLILYTSILMPIIYWTIILFTKDIFSIHSFAVAKLGIGLLMGGIYIYYLSVYLNIKTKHFVNYLLLSLFIAVTVFCISTTLNNLYVFLDKNTISLLVSLSFVITTLIVTSILYVIVVTILNQNNEKQVLNLYLNQIKEHIRSTNK